MKVLGVLDGRDLPADLLKAWALTAELIVAADGAADRLLELGVTPTIVVGDLDGSRADLGEIPVQRIDDQSSTDCDKLLRWAREHGHEEITLAGVEGDLPDHVLATLSSCAAFGRDVRLALRRGIGWVFRGTLEMNVVPGTRVSLIPLTPCDGVDLAGVQWPLARARLEIGGLISISNAATTGLVRARIARGAAFLFAEFRREDMPFWE